MSLSLRILRAICLTGAFVSGVFFNSLIAVVYFKDWRQSVKSRVCEQILLSTSITNVLLQCLITFDGVLYIYGTHVLFIKEVYILDYVFFFLLMECSFWLTCWLSIYYCLKIVNFSHQIFLRIKTKFFSFATQVLLGTAAGSLLINLPFVWTVDIRFLQNLTSTDENNYNLDVNLPFTIFNMMLGCCVPSLLTSISMGLSVTYLLRHVFRVKSDPSQFKAVQLEAHITAVRTMVVRLILDLAFFLIIAGSLTSEFSFGESWGAVCWILVIFYPTAQSVVLILGNSRLRTMVCCQGVAS